MANFHLFNALLVDLGAFGGSFGACWEPLGPNLEPRGTYLDPTWRSSSPLGSNLDSLGPLLKVYGFNLQILDASWASLDSLRVLSKRSTVFQVTPVLQYVSLSQTTPKGGVHYCLVTFLWGGLTAGSQEEEALISILFFISILFQDVREWIG